MACLNWFLYWLATSGVVYPFRSLTPAQPPFSGMNSTPVASRADLNGVEPAEMNQAPKLKVCDCRSAQIGHAGHLFMR